MDSDSGQCELAPIGCCIQYQLITRIKKAFVKQFTASRGGVINWNKQNGQTCEITRNSREGIYAKRNKLASSGDDRHRSLKSGFTGVTIYLANTVLASIWRTCVCASCGFYFLEIVYWFFSYSYSIDFSISFLLLE